MNLPSLRVSPLPYERFIFQVEFPFTYKYHDINGEGLERLRTAKFYFHFIHIISEVNSNPNRTY